MLVITGGMFKIADSWPIPSVVPVLLGALEESYEIRGIFGEGTGQPIVLTHLYDAEQFVPENCGHPHF